MTCPRRRISNSMQPTASGVSASAVGAVLQLRTVGRALGIAAVLLATCCSEVVTAASDAGRVASAVDAHVDSTRQLIPLACWSPFAMRESIDDVA